MKYNYHSRQIDCTVETSKCQRWGIKGFPTLDLIQNGHLVNNHLYFELGKPNTLGIEMSPSGNLLIL